MKFTKTAFRSALKHNDQTQVWYLATLYYRRQPVREEVQDLIYRMADCERDRAKGQRMAYESLRKDSIRTKMAIAWNNRGAYRQYDIHYYREQALKMLRRLYTEPLTAYTKIANFGHTHLYFCSPIYGHGDYNKVCTCLLNGPLATDKNGNRYDPQAAWCDKVLDLSNRIYDKKREAYDKAV